MINDGHYVPYSPRNLQSHSFMTSQNFETKLFQYLNFPAINFLRIKGPAQNVFDSCSRKISFLLQCQTSWYFIVK